MAMLGDTIRFDTARDVNSTWSRLDSILKEIDRIRNRLEAAQTMMKDNPVFTNADRQELRDLRDGLKAKCILFIETM